MLPRRKDSKNALVRCRVPKDSAFSAAMIQPPHEEDDDDDSDFCNEYVPI